MGFSGVLRISFRLTAFRVVRVGRVRVGLELGILVGSLGIQTPRLTLEGSWLVQARLYWWL